MRGAEQEAKSQKVDRLVLLTTRTADWFEQRGFQHAGPAHASPFLPEDRRQQVRNRTIATSDPPDCGTTVYCLIVAYVMPALPHFLRFGAVFEL